MIKKYLHLACAMSLIYMASNSALAAPTEIIGEVGNISTKTLTFLGGKSYPLARGDSKDMTSAYGTVTQCFVERGARTTCSTLAGVGFISKAKVTLDNGVVMKIEVLEMKQ